MRPSVYATKAGRGLVVSPDASRASVATSSSLVTSFFASLGHAVEYAVMRRDAMASAAPLLGWRPRLRYDAALHNMKPLTREWWTEWSSAIMPLPVTTMR